jgi:hypothetical protein
LIERRRLRTDHVHLLEHRELDAVGERAEILDLLLVTGLLALEIVGREAEHGKAAAGIALLQRLQAFVLRV